MTITFRLLEAYLKCPTKCWLKATSEQPSSGSYAGWAQAQNESYRVARIHELLSETCEGKSVNSPSVDDLKDGSWQLATDVLARTKNLESHIPAVERTSADGPGKPAQLVPLRFISTNKVEKDAKLLLAFDAMALAELGSKVSWGKIIHGDEHSIAKARVSALARDVQGRIEETAVLLSRALPSDLQLIRHCAECEFQARCRQKALEKDDLSLLSGMSQKERAKLHKKGIFTVTQLSYTFRPRRRPKALREKREKYLHSLRALAVREKKIYIVGSPELKIEGTPVYLDVEGLPDRNSYYLIGMRLGEGNSTIQHSLWADSINDEERIWNEFLAIMAHVKNPVLIHYGNYEMRFLKCMCARYGLHAAGAMTSRAIGTSVNLLSFAFGQIYFPIVSSSLKDVGLLFGAKWHGPITSGLQSITYRLDWELSRSPQLKAALLNYNQEDCAALEIVTSNLSEIIHEGHSREDVEFVYRPKRAATGQGEEVQRALQSILRSAQFRYSRSRIRISRSKDRSVSPETRSKKHSRWKSFSTIRGKIVWLPRRRICPRHPGHGLVLSSKTAQHSVIDLKFSETGCRKTVIRYVGRRGYCDDCHGSHVPRGIHRLRGQVFGRDFQAWVIYQRLAMRLSYRLISRAAWDLFSEELSPQTVAGFVERFSENYRPTEDLLLRRMLNAP